DDLSVVSQSDDGTRQTLKLMRELRKMTRKHGISALVLADSLPYVFDRGIAERDLRRARVLCSHADSVFALSAVGATDWRRLVQTRSQAGDLAWTRNSPANFKLATRDDGFIGFDFFEQHLSEQDWQFIRQIKQFHDAGHTF